MHPSRSYLVVATPRSGTGLLSSLLWSSGGLSRRVLLARQRRRLRKGRGTTSQREFLVEVLRRGAIPNRVFGATVMWTYIEEMLDLFSVATGRVGLPHEVLATRLPGLHYVHLMRRDRVAQ